MISANEAEELYKAKDKIRYEEAEKKLPDTMLMIEAAIRDACANAQEFVTVSFEGTFHLSNMVISELKFNGYTIKLQKDPIPNTYRMTLYW